MKLILLCPWTLNHLMLLKLYGDSSYRDLKKDAHLLLSLKHSQQNKWRLDQSFTQQIPLMILFRSSVHLHRNR